MTLDGTGKRARGNGSRRHGAGRGTHKMKKAPRPAWKPNIERSVSARVGTGWGNAPAKLARKENHLTLELPKSDSHTMAKPKKLHSRKCRVQKVHKSVCPCACSPVHECTRACFARLCVHVLGFVERAGRVGRVGWGGWVGGVWVRVWVGTSALAGVTM